MRPTPTGFFWKLFLGHAAVMAAVLGLGLWLVIAEFQRFHARQLVPYLTSHATALQPLVSDRFHPDHAAELDQLAKDLARAADGAIRVTFIAPDGTVLGDSHAQPAEMDNHADRPEIRDAFAIATGQARRWSDTVGREMLYVALRVGPADRPVGAIRTAMSAARVDAGAASARNLMWTLGLIGLLTAVLLALGLAWIWSSRIGRVTAAARSLLRGDLSARVDDAGTDEVALLARTLNRMRDRIAGQLDALDRHRQSVEDLLGQLHEGVIVADGAGQIVLMNPAARRLLNLPPSPRIVLSPDERLTIEQCVAQHDLQKLLIGDSGADGDTNAAENSPRLHEARAELTGADRTVTVLARATSIGLPEFARHSRRTRAAPRSDAGRLLVLTDVTELMRAVKMKTDFVANASHELRTPLSAIRAAVETLVQFDPADDPASARRCLDVITRHAGRLEQLVADLLDLSRVESAAGRFDPVPVQIARFCNDLKARWSEPLAAKNLHWSCELPPVRHTVNVNPYLLQLVLDNLVDNAIKFTNPGGNVGVKWTVTDGAFTVEVADDGCGIAESEQPRVFERFYQVSSSRPGEPTPSGPSRGTGLGLSIVRHATAAMGGDVALKSIRGKGTRVTVTLPQPPSPPTRP